MSDEITFGWISGRTLKYGVYEPDGSVRTAAGTTFNEEGSTGYYHASNGDILAGDIVIVTEDGAVVGYGEFEPDVNISDKTGFSLSVAGILAIWHQALASIVTASTIGKKLKDWVLGTDNKNLISTDAQDLSGTLDVNAKTVEDKTGYGLSDGAITAAKIAASALDGKGDWNTVEPDNTNIVNIHNVVKSGGTGDNAAIKAKTDDLNFTGTDVKATLDGEEVTTDSDSRTASKADVSNLDVAVSSRAPSGEYDTELDATISSRAPASEYDTQMARITADVATEAKQDIIDGNVDDIKEQTDQIQFNSDGEVIATNDDVSGLDTKLDEIIEDVTGLNGEAMRGTNNAATSAKQDTMEATLNLAATEANVDANETKIDAIKAETALIVEDTNEIQIKLPANKFMGSSDGADDNTTLDTIAGDVENIDGAAMRGTDGVSLVVPDAAGTAASLHSTTDGKIDAVKTVVDTIDTLTKAAGNGDLAAIKAVTDIYTAMQTAGVFTEAALANAPTAEMDEDEFHSALDSYSNKGDYKSDVSNLDVAVSSRATSAKQDTMETTLNAVGVDVAGLDGDVMRGTDGANTTVPDVAGTAATLHGTTDGKVDAVKAETALIVEDTNEIQGKLPANKFMGSSDGADDDGTLNTIQAKTDGLNFTGTDVKATLDGEEVVTDSASRTASKADVSNLDVAVSSRAPASEYDTEMARITADVATEAKQDIIDTNVDDIKEQTDQLQFNSDGEVLATTDQIPDIDEKLDTIIADVAGLDGEAMRGTDAAATEAKQDTIDNNVDEIKEQTDKLTFNSDSEVASDPNVFITSVDHETKTFTADDGVITTADETIQRSSEAETAQGVTNRDSDAVVGADTGDEAEQSVVDSIIKRDSDPSIGA